MILCRRFHGILNFNVPFIWLKISIVSVSNFKFQIKFFLCLKRTYASFTYSFAKYVKNNAEGKKVDLDYSIVAVKE